MKKNKKKQKKKKPVRVDHGGAGQLCALSTKARMQTSSVGKLDASVLRRECRLAASTHSVASLEVGECLCRSRGPVSAAVVELWRMRIVRGDTPTGPDGPDTRRGAGPGRPRPNGPVACERRPPPQPARAWGNRAGPQTCAEGTVTPSRSTVTKGLAH